MRPETVLFRCSPDWLQGSL